MRDSRVLLGRGSCTNGPDPLQVRPGFGPVCGFAEFIPVPARYLIKVNKDLPFEQRRLERARWREQLVKLRQSHQHFAAKEAQAERSVGPACA